MERASSHIYNSSCQKRTYYANFDLFQYSSEEQIKYNISVMVLISDAAKSENSAEDMVVYTVLESAANVTVKFHMNPVSNFTVHWSMGSSVLHDSNIKHTVTGNHVQTTYFISYVTNTQLGNYIVRVINFAIKNKPNEAIFKVKLKQRGKEICLC